MNELFLFMAGLVVGLSLNGIILLRTRHQIPEEVARLIYAVGIYAGDSSHENWRQLGTAYTRLLEKE